MSNEPEAATRRMLRKARVELKAARVRNLELHAKLAAAEQSVTFLKSDIDQLKAEVVKAEGEARRWLVEEGAGRIRGLHLRIDRLQEQLAEVLNVRPQARTALALARQKLESRKDDEVLAAICKLLEDILSGASES